MIWYSWSLSISCDDTVQCEFECESEENRVIVHCSRFSLSLCFVDPTGESSNFLKQDINSILSY